MFRMVLKLIFKVIILVLFSFIKDGGFDILYGGGFVWVVRFLGGFYFVFIFYLGVIFYFCFILFLSV